MSNSFFERVGSLGFILATSARIAPVHFWGLVGAQVGRSLAGLVVVYGLKLLTDAAVGSSANGVVLAAGAIALAEIARWLCAKLYVNLTLQLSEITALDLDKRLMRIVGTLALEHHERPDLANQLALARQEQRSIAEAVNALVLNLDLLLTLVGSAVLLARLDPRLLLMPLAGFGSFVAARQAHWIQQQAREASAAENRLAKHLYEVATAPSSAAEVRLFGLGDPLIARHRSMSDVALQRTERATLRGMLLNGIGSLLFAVAYLGGIALVLFHAMGGEATVGDVVLAVALTAQMGGVLGQAVNLGSYLLRVSDAARRYTRLAGGTSEVLSSADARLPAPARLSHGIDLINISFRYRGAERDALSNVSLHLPAGSVVALVGENGAGKSTLVKLLARFYDPTQGEISVDGQPLARIAPSRWHERVVAAFQDYARFEFRVGEAVGVGDLPHQSDAPSVLAAIDRAGATDFLSSLPDGLATQLGKEWEGGIDLSGGQWQKVALARACMRASPLLIVLDEPTAALDADAEHALFERFTTTAQQAKQRGAVTLIVSHRFSTVRMADLIVVLEKGRIIECGRHAELIARGGYYAELYNLQAAQYRLSPSLT